MDEKENINIREAAYNFITALSKITELDNEHDTATIILYSREKPHETITYNCNNNIMDNLEFICRKENDIGDFIALLKSDNIIYNCKIIDKDKAKRVTFFLMKPETENVISE